MLFSINLQPAKGLKVAGKSDDHQRIFATLCHTYHCFLCGMLCEEQAQKLHTNDVSLSRSE